MTATVDLTLILSLGVCAGICAWNGSHVLAAWKMAPAMAAGNTFVLKSSEKSPLALAAYGDLINEVRWLACPNMTGEGGRDSFRQLGVTSLTNYGRLGSHQA